MDDLILLCKTIDEMKEVKEKLFERFRMKDMGKLHYCLGISISHDEDNYCITLQQKQYIRNILTRFRLADAKAVSTPADPSVTLVKDDGVSKEVDPTLYQSMVGSLIYAAMATRPDIAQAVGTVSKFNSKPSEEHFTAVKRIFRYLRGTSDLTLRYQRQEDGSLVGYSDADWAGDCDDRRSTTGNVFLMEEP